jgi:hypothetical protein
MSKVINFPAASVKVTQEGVCPVYSLADLGGGAMDTSKGLVSMFADGQGASVDTCLRADLCSGTSLTDTPLVNTYAADWDNQELASLYRAQRLLGLTGISFDVERGRTDEGEPWFVFVDDAGEVLAHFCRMDGVYYLDSAAQTSLLMGHSLESLVSGFARRNQPVNHKDRGTGEAQVVHLTGGAVRSNVMMHPGVSLAALVWSIYLLSDTLILPVHGRDAHSLNVEADIDTAPDMSEAVSSPASLDHLSVSLHLQGSVSAAQNTCSGSREASAGPAVSTGGGVWGIGPGNGPFMNMVGLGLSALAMSYGIHLSNLPQNAVQMAKNAANSVTEILSERILLEQISVDMQMVSDDLAQAVAVLENKDAAMFLEAVVAGVQPSDIVTTLIQTTIVSDEFKMATVSFKVSNDRQARVLMEADVENMEQDGKNNTEQSIRVTQDNVEAANVMSNLSSVFEQYGVTLDFTRFDVLDEKYDIARILQTSSGTGTEMDPSAATPMLDTDGETLNSHTAAKIYPIFDDAANDFIVFLLMKQDNAQQSLYNGEVIFFDKSVFDTANVEIYARSWSFEDGSILSTVGSRSDFEDFGLII